MKLVIDIPEEIYKASKNMALEIGRGYGKMLTSNIYGAIATGIPLPKKHGDLVDRDKLREDMIKEYTYRAATSFISFEDLLTCVWLAPAVIRENNEE